MVDGFCGFDLYAVAAVFGLVLLGWEMYYFVDFLEVEFFCLGAVFWGVQGYLLGLWLFCDLRVPSCELQVFHGS